MQNQENITPLEVFLSFAPFFDNKKHFNSLINYTRTLNFRVVAVNEMRDLIQKQEFKLHKRAAETKPERNDYIPETIQKAYLEAFLSAVYALTETVAKITCHFYDTLPQNFHKQIKKLSKDPGIHPPLAKAMNSMSWYNAFREIRAEATHFGTSYVVWDPGTASSRGRSRMIIEVKTRKQNKVLKNNTFVFDFRDVYTIRDGCIAFLHIWADILLKDFDPKTKVSAALLDPKGKFKKSKVVTLKDVLAGKEKIVLHNNSGLDVSF